MTINTAALAKLNIGSPSSAAIDTLAEFQADTYTEVGEVEDLGSIGDAAEEIRFAALNDGRYRKLPGVRDAGTLPVVCGSDPSDVGQTAMLAAFDNNQLDYNFYIELHDKLTLSGENTRIYFRGRVMSTQFNIGNVNNVVRRNFNTGVNSALFIDPAT